MSPAAPLFVDGAVFELLVRLTLGAITSFLAILCWTRTRNLSWMFVIAGVLASYAGTLYRSLRFFGLFPGAEIRFFGTSLALLVSENLPIVLFAGAFIAFLRSER